MNKAQLLICALLFTLGESKGQITFDSTYDYQNQGAFGYSVLLIDSGYISFTASTNFITFENQDLLLYHFDQSGLTQNTSVITSTDLYYYTGLSGSLFRASDGTFVSGGSVQTDSDADFILVKYKLTGDTAWLRIF